MASSTERSAYLPNVHNGKLIDDITSDKIAGENVQPAFKAAEKPFAQQTILQRTQRNVKAWIRDPLQKDLVARWGLTYRNHEQSPTIENIRWNTWMQQLRSVAARRMPWRNPELEAKLAPLRTKTIYLHPVYQETRPNRSIVAQDLRGACLYAVGHVDVPDPKTLKQYTVSPSYTPEPSELVGMVHVRVKPRKELLKNTTLNWLIVYFDLIDHPEMWIHTCEWNGWAQWFDLQADQAILGKPHAHPLKSIAKAIWDEQHLARDENEMLMAKYMRALVHTACGPRAAQPDEQRVLGGAEALWSTHHVPQAWVRGQWLERAAQIEQACPDALLCYANVDSLHYSIHKDQLKHIHLSLTTTDTSWGSWKTVVIGDQGCWLSRGRYWIKKEGSLAYHQNYGNPKPWAATRRIRLTSGQRISLYAWRGLQKYYPLHRKEKHLTIHIPTPLSSHSFSKSLRRVIKDRPWKRKLWYLFQRG